MLKGMLGFGSVSGTVFTIIAFLNMEDGGGEAMMALRAAQLARNGEMMVTTANVLQGAARAGGVIDAAVAGASGGAILAPVGAGAGFLATQPGCSGN